MKSRTGEYADKGDYHLSLDPNWPYLPVYLEKMAWIRRFLDQIDPGKRILDVGCGEGTIVEEYRQKGYDITGLDLNYSSDVVEKGSILDIQYPDESFDIVMNLDVLEHLNFDQQEQAVSECARILKPQGIFLVSVPNMAHLLSRFSFLVTGRLIRTSEISRHPGDRPISEFLTIFQEHFSVRFRKGFFPTYPMLSLLTVWKPAKMVGLHKFINRLFAYPNWCFLNITVCEKKTH